MPYFAIHGHFYQPPRENPWTEEIDREPSAEPYHNWNERINEECYRANAFARVLADDGRVVDILNNYAYLSFNFGPTLLFWLRCHAADVYERIRQGDAASRARLGHGNAIAQTYNHMILPLANRRDKVTQVRWGLADFRYHFGRDAEAMWLAETAVDEQTLQALAEAGMRFVILSPKQAARVRPLDSADNTGWQSVADGSVDPSRAYVCRLRGGRTIAAFFYDGPLAHAAGYGELLTSSQRLVAGAAGAVDPARAHLQLIHCAVDGETFGHHKHLAQRTLIYALTHEAPARGFTVTNYAAYLEAAPPAWEVEIKPNTAWSCAHGLGRWSRDCGCRADGPPEWHQRWRAPLRAALDALRDDLAEIFERYAAPLMPDPWAARDLYGEVLPDRTPERVQAFLAQLAPRRLSADAQERALTLLEMQRHAMLMYTSCGWFFTELSGLESTQVLKYAARAIDLASRFGGPDLTLRFMAALEAAESNDARYRNGAEVYRQLVLPAAIGPERVAAGYALSALVHPFPVRHRRHAYRIEQSAGQLRQIGDYRLACGHIRLTSEFTGRQGGWTYAGLHLGGYNFAASVRPCAEPQKCAEVCEALARRAPAAAAPELLQMLKAEVDPTIFGLSDLPPSDRRRLMKPLDSELSASLATTYEQIYAEHLGTIHALRQASLPVPAELRLAAEYTLSHRLARAAGDLAEQPGDAAEANVAHVLHLAARDGLRLERGWAQRALERAVIQRTAELVRAPEDAGRVEPYDELIRLMETAERLGFEVRPARAQEMVLEHLRAQAPAWAAYHGQGWRSPAVEAALRLADQLRLSRQVISLPIEPALAAPGSPGAQNQAKDRDHAHR